LEKALKELDAFSYTVSHDLKAPLRAIDAFAAMLGEEAEVLSDNGRRYLDNLRQNTRKMAELISDLLALARLGRHQFTKRPVHMEGLVQQVIAEFQPQASRVVFHVKDIPSCHGDATLLRQLFANLVENAIKYSVGAEAPGVEIGGSRIQGEIVYYVKDNGCGFHMRHSHQLFKPFSRLHTDPNIDGTGIGLAIVKQVAGKHSGRVWAESEPGKGATFYFALPDNDHSTNH
jgi:light-regulated signal transduction histidine kinase (bacteriophytochrome)